MTYEGASHDQDIRNVQCSQLLPLESLKPLLPGAQEQCLVSSSNWLRGFPILTPALISEGTAESVKIRQEDKDSNTTFLWFLFHSASTEENPAEMWKEWLDGANFWEGLQWNLSALLPLLSQVKSLSLKRCSGVLHSSGIRAEVHKPNSYLQGGCEGFTHWWTATCHPRSG